jgi:hypothetical protein
MRRWHADETLMRRRQNFEKSKHFNRTTGATDECHCLAGIGTMRKHRPNESCGDRCSLCDLQRLGKRLARRKARRLLKCIADPIEFNRVARWW